MDKIRAFQIAEMTLSGFKSYSRETTFEFGSTTVITGGNGRGKSSLADAIAFAVTGLPFFGERKLDRLHSDDNPQLYIRMRFIDENGAMHELIRTRQKGRMAITYDGYEVRQLDLTEMFGERDVFLSILNPLYFIEELGDDGRQLLERYLPLIPPETVLARLPAEAREALSGLELSAPEARLRELRGNIRDMESTITYLQGQMDLAAEQSARRGDAVAELTQKLNALRDEKKALEEKRFSGMDIPAMQEELAALSAEYSELSSAAGSSPDDRLVSLSRQLGARKASAYAPKYTDPIAETSAKIWELAQRYRRETELMAAIAPGFECPTCRRGIEESDIPAVQASFKSSIAGIIAEGREKRAQMEGLQELERKGRETFERFKADDIAKLESELESLGKPVASENGRALHERIQQLSIDMEFGALSRGEYERLKSCAESLALIEKELAAQNGLELPSRDKFEGQISELEKKIAAHRECIKHLTCFVGKRAELTFSQLHINRVAISLYDVIKSTGEVKDVFRFTYGGRLYDRLSLSEKIRAGMEVSELFKRLTDRRYPTFADNMESVDDLNNIRPTGQLIMAKCVAGAELSVRAAGAPVSEQKAA